MMTSSDRKICPGHDTVPPGAHHPTFTFECVESIVHAIASVNSAGTTTFTEGCGLYAADAAGIPAAVDAAKKADVVVLSLGIDAKGDSTPGSAPYYERETHDRQAIVLPPVQVHLAQAVVAVGRPTVVFLMNGGSVDIPAFILDNERVAVIEGFYPGMEGGQALAQQLFGMANRWGKMPYSIYPAGWVESNSMLDHDVTHGRTYRYATDQTGLVVRFGAGLSLTAFTLTFAASTASTASTAAPGPSAAVGAASTHSNITLATDGSTGNVTFTIDVNNVGAVTGDAVVMAYMIPSKVSLKQYPVKSLFDFARLNNVGASTTNTATSSQVTFTVNRDSLLLVSQAGDKVSTPGIYTLSFEDGAGQVLAATLTIVGKETVVEPFPTVAS